MDINPLSDINEEESDVEFLEDDEEFFSLEESDDELGESEIFTSQSITRFEILFTLAK